MVKKSCKEKHVGMPVEKHDTAAWASMESIKPASNVHIPAEIQVRNAKEHVDTNEK